MVVVPDNSYCQIFLTFFKSDVNVNSSVAMLSSCVCVCSVGIGNLPPCGSIPSPVTGPPARTVATPVLGGTQHVYQVAA